MDFEFYQELRECFAAGDEFVLCTVVEASGSSPARVGQKMVVFADGTIRGTVGGGVHEEDIRRQAVALFATGGSRLLAFDLAGEITSPAPVCGGSFRCFIELLQDRPKLFIFGAGHIGEVLCALARPLRFRVTVVDERSDFARPERLPGADAVVCRPYEGVVAGLGIDARSSVVIVTPGHVKDREVLTQVISTPAAYVGMIGSQRKWEEMKKSMVDQGISRAKLDSVHCPIGVNLVGQSPAEIALGILAQIVAARHGRQIPFQRCDGR